MRAGGNVNNALYITIENKINVKQMQILLSTLSNYEFMTKSTAFSHLIFLAVGATHA